MKRKTLLFFILCNFVYSITLAQQYQPIPDSNASWIIQQDDGWGGFYINKFSLSPNWNDTVINSIHYTKLFFRFDTGPIIYHGAFRNSTNGKSYYMPANSDQEYLLRDFTKNTGDTIKNIIYSEGLVETWILDFMVDSIEYKNSGPYNYKIMYLSTVVEDTIPNVDPFESLVWMEKIGSFGGGILNSYRGQLSIQRLCCMQYNDTIYYNTIYWWFFPEDITYEFGECNDPVGLEDINTVEIGMRIAPNPVSCSTSVYFEIDQLNNFNNYLMIFDLYGKEISSFEFHNSFFNIKSPASNGVYIVKIFTKNNYYICKLIVTN